VRAVSRWGWRVWHPELQPDAAPVSIFVVIVLYKTAPSQSATYRMLLESIATVTSHIRVEVLLYDNTPGVPPGALPDGVHYVASPANSGLSTAYNVATEWAARKHYTWLLTLDQDTSLPHDFLTRLSVIAAEQQRNHAIAAIVPQLSAGEKLLSPWHTVWISPRYFPRSYNGLPKQPVYAFNSASLVRVEALQKIGGYSPLFWLDNSDTYLYRRLEVAGLRVFVAGSIPLQHDLSMMSIKSKMSLQRYRDSLESGGAFCDLELNWIYGLEQTGRLIRLYLSQVYRKREPEIKRITWSVIWSRMVRSKKRRIREWLAAQHARIASYETQQR
jgi:GT2 family glycosyltransferase